MKTKGFAILGLLIIGAIVAGGYILVKKYNLDIKVNDYFHYLVTPEPYNTNSSATQTPFVSPTPFKKGSGGSKTVSPTKTIVRPPNYQNSNNSATPTSVSSVTTNPTSTPTPTVSQSGGHGGKPTDPPINSGG